MAEIAALQAELTEPDGGVYADPKTGRWFIVMRPPGRAKTTTRRRAPDGSRLSTREQALLAKGRWEAQLARGEVAVRRERFETYWPRYLRHAKGEMTHGSASAPTCGSSRSTSTSTPADRTTGRWRSPARQRCARL
jgi:hypothetical protein